MVVFNVKHQHYLSDVLIRSNFKVFFDVIPCRFAPTFAGECCTHIPSRASGSGGKRCFVYIDNPFLIRKGGFKILC